MNKKLFAIFLVLAAVLAFVGLTSKNGVNESGVFQDQDNSIIFIPNQGGSMEGHTPRGFAGTGSGLFVGDNLNSGFPEGDGVQMFLTFDISRVLGVEITSALLRARSAEVRGNPFDDLGDLIVEAVVYDVFSVELWESKAVDSVCTLTEMGGGTYGCDISSFIKNRVALGESKVQFRVRFEKPGDNDGMQDMVFFYKSSENVNESGIFNLEITPRSKDQSKKESGKSTDSGIQVPITAFLVKESDEVSTGRNEKELGSLFEDSQRIWDQADIVLNVSIEEVVLSEDQINSVASGNFRELYSLLPAGKSVLYVFYVSDLFGSNGIALSPSVALVADITTVDDFRATAHEIGHLLGIEHTQESESRLMFPGANGRNLSADEIAKARVGAALLN